MGCFTVKITKTMNGNSGELTIVQPQLGFRFLVLGSRFSVFGSLTARPAWPMPCCSSVQRCLQGTQLAMRHVISRFKVQGFWSLISRFLVVGP